ncbi:MAG: YggS family pyridoxal phosphate-dependent enzyme [Candidatus Gastranaerophilales bacterium]|nr:YggS family pyridoxal phosphate-dependent enzyme [Candidatus Gastranaerophilales bacterium]
MSMIADNIKNIRDELNGYQGRIIAVSKYVDAQDMVQAYEAGIRDFAESKAQDALVKIESLPKDMEKDCTWHFIGHLQTNKVKKVVGNFEYIHSVDSLKLAETISVFAKEKGLTQKILLQVNIADEETKFGFSSKELFEALPKIIKLENIQVEGLMTMAPYTGDDAYLASLFHQVKELKEKLECNFGLSLKELSMGMSNDYVIAAKEGSTMLRVGTKIFK